MTGKTTSYAPDVAELVEKAERATGEFLAARGLLRAAQRRRDRAASEAALAVARLGRECPEAAAALTRRLAQDHEFAGELQ